MTTIEAISFTIYEMVNMLLPLVYLFGFVFVLSLVVIVHEGGHFCVARWCGVHVTEFSLGFGKELWGRNDKKGTRWKICAVPLGGYVKMLGDEDAASSKSSTDNVPKELRHKTFMAQKLWKRASIIFAGPATNYLFAFIVLVCMIFFFGIGQVEPVVGEVIPDSAAEEVGILKDDRILSINGENISEFSDLQRQVRILKFGEPLNLEIQRGDEILNFKVQPKYEEGFDAPLVGVRASQDYYTIRDDIGFWESVSLASQQIGMVTKDTLIYLGQIIRHGRLPKEMRGPLGIAEASGDALLSGILPLIVFIANISLAVGLMNLLPIPLLDGGHLFLYGIEAIIRRPLPTILQNGLMWFGFIVLMGLVGYTFFLDIPRLVQRIFG